jgi:hypothetical protein
MAVHAVDRHRWTATAVSRSASSAAGRPRLGSIRAGLWEAPWRSARHPAPSYRRSRLRPVTADPFESAWLKWAMAVTNARVLADNVETFASDFGSDLQLRMHSQLATYYNAKSHCVVLVVTEATDPFPVLWGVLLGETAHDYRCCLDHVAWALYKRGRTPDLGPGKERYVSFPIYGKRIEFNKVWTGNCPECEEQIGQSSGATSRSVPARAEPTVMFSRFLGTCRTRTSTGRSSESYRSFSESTTGSSNPPTASFGEPPTEASPGGLSQAQNSYGSTSRRPVQIRASRCSLTSRSSRQSTGCSASRSSLNAP